jgi:cytochrome c553
MAPLMRAAVDGLSDADMIDIAAYLGTLPLNP